MNQVDRNRLIRIQQIIEAVPFGAHGTATSTGYGAIQYEQDMRALRPKIVKILQGMVMESLSGFESGYDYDDPEKLLTVVEAWITKRQSEGWQNASSYSLDYFTSQRPSE